MPHRDPQKGQRKAAYSSGVAPNSNQVNTDKNKGFYDASCRKKMSDKHE